MVVARSIVAEKWLRADAEHPIRFGDLGVDEHRTRTSRKRAAAVDPPPVLWLTQRRTSASVSFDTGLSSTTIASTYTWSYGRSASRTMGTSSIDVRSLSASARCLSLTCRRSSSRRT
jgi:hypothetical protein